MTTTRNLISGQSQNNFDFKYLILGDTGVGKTAVLRNFVSKKFRHSNLKSIGAEYGTKTLTLSDHSIRFQIWDIAGLVRNDF